MSNRLFQGVIHQMKDAIDKTIGILDEGNTVIACSELGRIGETVSLPSNHPADIFTAGGYTFKAIILRLLRATMLWTPSISAFSRLLSPT